MSRSGYNEDCDDNWSLICWRGAVKSALRGKRGQSFLRELAEAMDAMPVKRLVAGELQADGEFCALGVIGNKRGIDLEAIDPDDAYTVAQKFDIATAMAREIVYENDEHHAYSYELMRFVEETPEQRFVRMRKWIASEIVEVTP